MQTLKKLLFIFNRNQKIKLIILFIMMFVGAVFELLGVTILLPFINILIDPGTVEKNDFMNRIYSLLGFSSVNYFLVFMACIIVLVYVVKNVFYLVQSDVQFQFGYNNQRRLSYRMMNVYMQQPYLFHTSNNSADLMRNVSSDSGLFFRAVIAMLGVMTDSSICVVMLIFLLYTDKTITIGLAILMFALTFLYVMVYKKKSQYYGKGARSEQGEMNKWMIQSFNGIKIIKLDNCEPYFLKKFDDAYKKYAYMLRKNNYIGLIPKPVMETSCVAGILFIVSVKLLRGVDMEYFVPTLTTFAVAAFRMMPSVNKISSNLNTVLFCKSSIDEVYDILHQLQNMQSVEKLEYKENNTFSFENKISTEYLSFKYPDSEKYVLEDVSIDIPKNKSVAFIGPSGAGKTTLADIILGVLYPSKGSVLVDGVDTSTDIHAWYRNLGYIPQSIYMIDDSVRRNIAFGIPDEEIDDEKVWKALENAQIKEYVEHMENGLDTYVGENGIKLSGGQRQRMGIARALYHNPDVLVLDEATSALDNETEAAVMDAINHLAGTKTMIIIAHRLSTIENCDIVYEVKDGKVTQKR